MDFKFSTEEEDFREEVRDFLKEEIPEDWDGPQGLGGEEEDDWEFEFKMRKRLAEKGWLTMAWPEEYGGQDAPLIKQVIFNEEMTYHRAPGRDGFGVPMLGPTLMIHGTEEQKRRYLPPIARGEVQWCQGYSEPESGSDLASLQTRAVRRGRRFLRGQRNQPRCGRPAPTVQIT